MFEETEGDEEGMTEKRLGPSQQAVYEWLQKHPYSTPQSVGDALYSVTSSCAKSADGHMGGKATFEERRRAWATKMLNELLKKGLVKWRRCPGEGFAWNLHYWYAPCGQG